MSLIVFIRRNWLDAAINGIGPELMVPLLFLEHGVASDTLVSQRSRTGSMIANGSATAAFSQNKGVVRHKCSNWEWEGLPMLLLCFFVLTQTLEIDEQWFGGFGGHGSSRPS